MTCAHERIAVDRSRKQEGYRFVRCLDCGQVSWLRRMKPGEGAYRREKPGGWTFKRVDSNA